MEYIYKGPSYCGFCDKDAIFHRDTCLTTPKCKVDVHWCGAKCNRNVKKHFAQHDIEYHTAVDLI